MTLTFLELLTFSLSPPERWDDRQVLLYLLDVQLETDPEASRTLGKHPSN